MKFTDTGKIIIYIALDDSGNPIRVSDREEEMHTPYRVRYIENE